MSPRHIAFPPRLCGIALALLATACVTKGEVQIARPHVYDPETTRTEIKKAGRRIVSEVRKREIDTVQESFGVRELISVRGSVATAGAGAAGATPAAAGAPPAPLTDIKPGLPTAPATTGFGKTLPEMVNDLAHRERQAIELDLLYSGAADPDLIGRNVRIYLVRFDMGIFPHRQGYLMYPLLWIRSTFGTVYNFTKGWYARTAFWMPSRPDASTPPFFVYDIDPRYSVITANETLANLLSTQLTATGGTPAVQAQIEYLRQLEEQFAQQRRYPLQMGLIDGRSSFSWIYGPRRRVEKRSGLSRLNPFASKYKVVSRLEPGIRTGHVLIVVPDITKLRAELAALTEDQIRNGLRLFAEPQEHRHYKCQVKDRVVELAKEIAGRLTTKPAASNAADAASYIELPLVVQGNFMMLDRPYVRHPLPVRSIAGDSCCDPFGRERGNREAKESLGVFYLKLPKGPPGIKSPVAISIDSENHPYRNMGDQLGRFVLTMPDDVTLEEAPRKVSLYADEVGPDPLTVRSQRLLAGSKNKVGVIFVRPAKPAGEKAATADLTLAVSVETRERRYVANQALTLASVTYRKAAPKKPGLSESFGAAGELVTIALGEKLVATDVNQVLFGTHVIGRAAGEKAGWWVADAKGKAIQLLVPEPPRGARDVRVVLRLNEGAKPKNKGLEYLSVGSFSYATSVAR